jgi:ribosomal protein S18 acetylase RimI-like enzyme
MTQINNTFSLSLYKKHGFNIEGICHGQYKNGLDGVDLIKII